MNKKIKGKKMYSGSNILITCFEALTSTGLSPTSLLHINDHFLPVNIFIPQLGVAHISE